VVDERDSLSAKVRELEENKAAFSNEEMTELKGKFESILAEKAKMIELHESQAKGAPDDRGSAVLKEDFGKMYALMEKAYALLTAILASLEAREEPILGKRRRVE